MSNWQSTRFLQQQCHDKNTLAWLSYTGSTSQAIQDNCGALHIQVLAQGLQNLLAEEQTQLTCSEKTGYVREVLIYGQIDQLIMYARTSLSLASYQHWKTELDQLNNQPIGPNLLFKDQHFQALPIQYCQISNLDPFSQAMRDKIPSAETDLMHWARQRQFCRDQDIILITEIWHPNLPRFIEKTNARSTN